MNIARALSRARLSPVMLSHIGHDPEGDELMRRARSEGCDLQFVFRSNEIPTDVYMAVECPEGLVAAIADAHGLEAAGGAILSPLSDGRLGSESAPFGGVIALDGNLTESLLGEIASSPLFRAADLRIAPASPGKAARLRPLMRRAGATVYVNLEEAGLIAGAEFAAAPEAAQALAAMGAGRALVTNGAHEAAFCGPDGAASARPPRVEAAHFTGAGDTFMAAHIAAELGGADMQGALEAAVRAAATYVKEGP